MDTLEALSPRINDPKKGGCDSLQYEKSHRWVQIEKESMPHINPKMKCVIDQQCPCQIRRFNNQIGEAERLLKMANQAREQIEAKIQEKQFIKCRMDSEMENLAYRENDFKWRIADTRQYLEEEQYKPYSRSNHRQKEVGRCTSVVEELNNLSKKLHYQILHKGSNLAAEKRLLKEIEQLASAKEKVGSAPRASHLYSWNYSLKCSLLKETCIERRIQIIRCQLDETKENQQAHRDKIKRVKKEIEALEMDLVDLRKELEKLGSVKNEAHALIIVLEKQRDKVQRLQLSEEKANAQGFDNSIEMESQLEMDEQNILQLLRVGKFRVESTLKWGARDTKSHMYQDHDKYGYYQSKPWNGRGTSIYYKRTGNFLPRKLCSEGH